MSQYEEPVVYIFKNAAECREWLAELEEEKLAKEKRSREWAVKKAANAEAEADAAAKAGAAAAERISEVFLTTRDAGNPMCCICS